MVKFLGYCGPKFYEILHLPQINKATLIFLKKKSRKKKENPKEKETLPREVKDTVTVFRI